MIKVSVIVPVFNAEKYIRRCLDSLIHQTMKEIEIICIDDGSTDKSFQILSEYENLDHRIIVYQMKKNQGVAVSRNKGLNLARGKYVQFIDADDYIEVATLEKLYERSDSIHSDICFFKLKLQKEDQRANENVSLGIKGVYNDTYVGKELMALFIKNEEFFLYTCLVFYRKKFLDENRLRFKKLTIGEGGNMILRSLYKARIAIVDNGVYYHYCLNSQSATNQDNKKILSLIGQLYQYIDMMRILADEKNSIVLEDYLKNQYKKIKGGVDSLSNEEREFIKNKLEDDFAKCVFYMLINKEQYTYISPLTMQEITLMKNAEKIIIFGTGYASKDMIQLLNDYRINILGFAVSDIKKNPTSLFGHPVYEIKELQDFRQKALIVVAANRKYHDEIRAILEKYGFVKTIFLNVKI